MHLKEVSGCGTEINESHNDFDIESKFKIFMSALRKAEIRSGRGSIF